MSRLFGILYGIGGTTLAGSGVVVALVAGWYTLWPILLGALIGALAAVPLCWIVARRLTAGPG